MTYIDRLNSFNRWLESNALPGNAQLMYFRLLNVFNRAGWPESVQIDNLRLMMMADLKSEKTAITIRDRLVGAGLLRYEKGRKGKPNRYFLTEFHCNNYSGSDSVSDSETASISVSTNASHIKNKNKNRIKNRNASCSEKTYDIKELEGLADLRLPEHL